MPCQMFAQKCENCQEIAKISKYSGSPRTLMPLELYRDILLLGIITLQHVIHKNSRLNYWCFLMVYGPLSEDREQF